MIDNFIDQLKRDEGIRFKPYRDTRGVWTVGYGRNLDVHRADVTGEITQMQADLWLTQDAHTALGQVLNHLPWTMKLDEARRGVLVNMAFNVGIGALLGFNKTLGFVESGEYSSAADEMLNSDWATQVGDRAKRLAEQMRTGQWI